MTARARALDPFDPLMHALSSQVAYQAGDYPEALQQSQLAIGLDAEFWIGHVVRGQALRPLGQLDPALEALTTAGRFSNYNSKTMSFRGHLLARAGRAAEAREVLRTLVSVQQRNVCSARMRWRSSRWGSATRTRRSSGSSARCRRTTST